jgi:multidrug efflux pump subunit AcrB
MFILILIGLVALPKLSRETFPNIERYEVLAAVVYPGASASDVEEGICLELEDGTDGISYMAEKRCDARNSLARMTFKMNEDGDIDQFLQDIKDKVAQIQTFPDKTEEPVITEVGLTSQVVSVAISGPMTDTQLKRFAEQLKDEMLYDPLINLVDVEGFSQPVINVEVSSERLQMYGVSISQIANVIARQNTDLPAGDIQTHDKNYAIRISDLRRSPEELGQLVIIRNDQGNELILDDIADIQLNFDNHDDQVWLNGQRAALLNIKKNKQEDGIRIKQAVSNFLEKKQALLPKGIELTLTKDMVSIAQGRLQLLMENGLQGLILVFLTMWLFFSFRYSFWVAMGLPVSFMASFMMMMLMGVSINMISMVALLIALGILMDDAIVLSESIATRLQKAGNTWADTIDAVWHGVEKVKRGVFSSFITTVLVFGSLIFITGDMGQILKVLPIVLISVISVSLIEAFLILPHHLSGSRDNVDKAKPKFKQAFDDRFQALNLKVYGAAKLAVQYRYVTFGLAVVAFLLSISLLSSGTVKFQGFPTMEGDILEARILMPQGTPLQHTKVLVEKVEQAIRDVNEEIISEGTEPSAVVESIQTKFGINSDAYESGPHLATVSLDLLGAELRNIQMLDLIARWNEKVGDVPEAIQIQYKEPVRGPSGRPIEIRLSGKDINQINAAAIASKQILSRYSGVYALQTDLRPGQPEFSLTLKPGAYSLGIDASNIAQQFRSALTGTTVSNVRLGEDSYDINVKYDAQSRDSLGDLDNFKIVNENNGALIPLNTVANVDAERNWSRIHRINGVRTVTLYGELDTRITNTQEVLTDFQSQAMEALQQNYPDVHFNFEGEVKNSAQTGSSMVQGFILSLIGIYLLLSFQFRNYLEPIVVMVAIPFALIGVIWGHFIMGLPMTMPSMMGFVSLAGIVVNNSILLVEFIKYRVSEGHSIHDAAALASKDRFRAIFITSMTTMAGMAPLLFETSLQAQSLVPLVCSIVFGLLSSTIMVLFVVPALFSILEDFGFKEPEEEITLAREND